MTTKNKKIYFITGSQTLYGEATLQKVATHAQSITKAINEGINLPIDIEYKSVVKSPEEIASVVAASNADEDCIGLIIWMHTFSPAKMWINGLNKLQLPLLHLHTQFNSDIPFDTIDMDFMNLNQSAHGDREMAHLLSKMSVPRKIVVGHWSSPDVLTKIDRWSRLAMGLHRMHHMKIVRFGDNMRYVSVTDGDKVSAEIKFGFSVNTHGVGDLVQYINSVEEKAIAHLMSEYDDTYTLQDALRNEGSKRQSLYDAAKIELGIRNFLEEGGYHAYTNTFEDLHGMKQLPGIGSQRLMQAGYGFGAEGDWKTSGLLHVMKYMAQGMAGGNSFMEDYTYHFDPLNEMVLGSHMLEICPSIAEGQVQCEVHPLGIGGKEDPVRLVFNASKGPAVNASLVDMGDRFRLILNKVEGLEVTEQFPHLPTARALWRPYPSMQVGLEAWLLAGGAHHTMYSQNLDIDFLADFGEMLGIETLIIDESTNIRQMKETLKLNSIYYSFNK